MRAPALFSCAILLIACAKTEQKAASDSPAAVPAATPAPAPAAALSLAELAGKWTQRTRAEGSDSVLVTSTITATADTTGWTIALPNRPVMPVRVAVSGDSLMAWTGPYESVLRKGVQVTTYSVYRKQGDKLVGITIAHYKAAGADSVRRLSTEMTKNP